MEIHLTMTCNYSSWAWTGKLNRSVDSERSLDQVGLDKLTAVEYTSMPMLLLGTEAQTARAHVHAMTVPLRKIQPRTIEQSVGDKVQD